MKQEEKKKLSLERIINASIPVFAEDGLNNASLNKICENNNLSKGLIYHYFDSKKDIFCACINTVLTRLTDDINSFYVDPDKDMYNNFRDYYIERIDFWLEHPIYFNLLRDSYHISDPEIENKIFDAKQKFNNSTKEKTFNILRVGNCANKIANDEWNEIIQLIYESLFLYDIAKIVKILSSDDWKQVESLKNQLLKFYEKLIYVFLYGILDR